MTPRALDYRWQADRDYEDRVVSKVEKHGNGYTLTADGWSIGAPDVGYEPVVGDTVRYFGEGVGYSVRGLVVFPKSGAGPVVLRYETHEEEAARHKRELEDQHAKAEAKALADRPVRDARIAALPEPLRRRFETFSKAPHFQRDYEEYEIFTCEQAALISISLGSGDEVMAFTELPWEQQLAKVPGLSNQHSGNTFGMAVRLAYWLLSKPENAAREHGAMVGLVGCAAYGCHHEGDR